jgi:hypothetical protein
VALLFDPFGEVPLVPAIGDDDVVVVDEAEQLVPCSPSGRSSCTRWPPTAFSPGTATTFSSSLCWARGAPARPDATGRTPA